AAVLSSRLLSPVGALPTPVCQPPLARPVSTGVARITPLNSSRVATRVILSCAAAVLATNRRISPEKLMSRPQLDGEGGVCRIASDSHHALSCDGVANGRHCRDSCCLVAFGNEQLVLQNQQLLVGCQDQRAVNLLRFVATKHAATAVGDERRGRHASNRVILPFPFALTGE